MTRWALSLYADGATEPFHATYHDDAVGSHEPDLAGLPLTIAVAQVVAMADDRVGRIEWTRQVVTAQEPACRWAHGPVADLDDRGLCAVCAADEEPADGAPPGQDPGAVTDPHVPTEEGRP